MELINKIQENNLPFTPQELEKIQEIATQLEQMPKPASKTEAQLFLNKVKEFKIYTSVIEEFVADKVKKANQQHKLGVAKLKELKEVLKDATNMDKVLEYANEELAKNPLFKLSGTTKKSGWIEYVYDEEEIIKVIITYKEMLPFVKLDKKALEKWLKENPSQNIFPIKEIKQIKSRTTILI